MIEVHYGTLVDGAQEAILARLEQPEHAGGSGRQNTAARRCSPPACAPIPSASRSYARTRMLALASLMSHEFRAETGPSGDLGAASHEPTAEGEDRH
jgi:hypothetical protein